MSIVHLAIIVAFVTLIILLCIVESRIDSEIKALKEELKIMGKTLNSYFEDDLK